MQEAPAAPRSPWREPGLMLGGGFCGGGSTLGVGGWRVPVLAGCPRRVLLRNGHASVVLSSTSSLLCTYLLRTCGYVRVQDGAEVSPPTCKPARPLPANASHSRFFSPLLGGAVRAKLSETYLQPASHGPSGASRRIPLPLPRPVLQRPPALPPPFLPPPLAGANVAGERLAEVCRSRRRLRHGRPAVGVRAHPPPRRSNPPPFFRVPRAGSSRLTRVPGDSYSRAAIRSARGQSVRCPGPVPDAMRARVLTRRPGQAVASTRGKLLRPCLSAPAPEGLALPPRAVWSKGLRSVTWLRRQHQSRSRRLAIKCQAHFIHATRPPPRLYLSIPYSPGI